MRGYDVKPYDVSKKFVRRDLYEESPSSRHGLHLELQAYFRRLYVALIQDAGIQLKLPQGTIATAILFCHRYYVVQSMTTNDRLIIAIACLFLAGKVDETPKSLKDVLRTCFQLRYGNRPADIQKLQEPELMELMRERVLHAERAILYAVGFDFNVKHPYKLALKFITDFKLDEAAGLSEDVSLQQVAWNLINDSYRSLVGLQYPAEDIAIAIIFLALKMLKGRPVLGAENQQWWEMLGMSPAILLDIIAQLMDMYEEPSGGFPSPTTDMQPLSGNAPDGPGSAGDVHAPCGDVHASPGDVHAPAGDVHAPAGDVHAPAGDVHAPAQDVHAPGASLHAPAGEGGLPWERGASPETQPPLPRYDPSPIIPRPTHQDSGAFPSQQVQPPTVSPPTSQPPLPPPEQAHVPEAHLPPPLPPDAGTSHQRAQDGEDHRPAPSTHEGRGRHSGRERGSSSPHLRDTQVDLARRSSGRDRRSTTPHLWDKGGEREDRRSNTPRLRERGGHGPSSRAGGYIRRSITPHRGADHAHVHARPHVGEERRVSTPEVHQGGGGFIRRRHQYGGDQGHERRSSTPHGHDRRTSPAPQGHGPAHVTPPPSRLGRPSSGARHNDAGDLGPSGPPPLPQGRRPARGGSPHMREPGAVSIDTIVQPRSERKRSRWGAPHDEPSEGERSSRKRTRWGDS